MPPASLGAGRHRRGRTVPSVKDDVRWKTCNYPWTTSPDPMRAIYLDGIVLDEYADMDPRVWSEIIRPALADRRGWAVFIGTPKGRNAFFELWRRSQAEEGWFSMLLKASDSGLIPASELALARRDLSEEQYAQEFECSFDAAVVGSYSGRRLARADADQRIDGVPYDP